MGLNIADLFEHAVDAVPDRTALISGADRRTFAELDARANRLGHALAARGIGHGDHVGIYALNRVEWLEAMLAIFKVRAVPINVNYRYVADELRYLFDNADLVGLVYGKEFSGPLDEVRGELPGLKVLVEIDDGSGADTLPGAEGIEALMAEGSPERGFPDRSPDDHYVIYTGGTTGMPKGVMWRHEDVFYALGGGFDAYSGARIESDMELADRARASGGGLTTYASPPLMHGAAQWASLRFFFEGNTVVLPPKFDPVQTWHDIAAERVNVVMITGDAMGRPLIEAWEALDPKPDVSSLFVLSSSAAIFSPTVKDQFLAHFGSLMIVDSIGSSESGHNGMVQLGKGADTSMEGGPRVQAGPDLAVLDESLTPIPAGDGRIGKLGRAGNIPLGYYKDEVKTAATFVTASDGRRYVIPGDFARLEADGTITLLGRGSVSINSGGEKIFPEEVEAALKSHPSVFDAIVVGVPDERWGQRIAAVIQPRPGHTPVLDDLATHCRTKIAGYKVPRQLHLVDEMVRSPSGKPDYPWAARLAAAETA